MKAIIENIGGVFAAVVLVFFAPLSWLLAKLEERKNGGDHDTTRPDNP